MRLLNLIILLALAAAPALAAEDPFEIRDGTNDPTFHRAPMVTFPDPSVDLTGVDFSADGSMLVVEFHLVDVDWSAPGLTPQTKGISAWFSTEAYSAVRVTAYIDSNGKWRGHLGCHRETAWDHCFVQLDAPVIDITENTITVRAPWMHFGPEVRSPYGNSQVRYGPDAWPMAYVGDMAPDCSLDRCGRGRDFTVT